MGTPCAGGFPVGARSPQLPCAWVPLGRSGGSAGEEATQRGHWDFPRLLLSFEDEDHTAATYGCL